MEQRYKKNKILICSFNVICILILTACLFLCAGCETVYDKSDKWKEKFDISLPQLEKCGFGKENANENGWYMTLNDDFEGTELNDTLWAAADHGARVGGYWCNQMIEVKDGSLIIRAERKSNHNCSVCPGEGIFTGGIISAVRTGEGAWKDKFTQAFGYYEVKVKFPKAGGMWSAFWLNAKSIRNTENKGEDGSEIDVFESSFYNTEQNKVGHAIHYDGYGSKHKCMGAIRDAGSNLYEDNDGWHTFALKWTEKEYVFYVDGVANWASDFGGVSKVPSYLLLTIEVNENATGPYGQKLGAFSDGNFIVDYVRVYQNINYLPFIKSAEDFN